MTALKLLFQTRLAGDNILFPALFLEPGTNLRLCFVGLDDAQPCTVWPFVGVFAGENLTDLPRLERIVQRNRVSAASELLVLLLRRGRFCLTVTVKNMSVRRTAVSWCLAAVM